MGRRKKRGVRTGNLLVEEVEEIRDEANGRAKRGID